MRATKETTATWVEIDDAVWSDSFLVVASELTEEACGEAGYTEARLTEIESLLAAHFYAIRKRIRQTERAGSVGTSYESKIDFGLKFTRFGDQAMTLDTKGGLAALDSRKTKVIAGAWWGGVERTETGSMLE